MVCVAGQGSACGVCVIAQGSACGVCVLHLWVAAAAVGEGL